MTRATKCAREERHDLINRYGYCAWLNERWRNALTRYELRRFVWLNRGLLSGDDYADQEKFRAK